MQNLRPNRDGFFLFYGYLWVMGFERRIRKHAGGMFSRRGRIPNAPAFLSVHLATDGFFGASDGIRKADSPGYHLPESSSQPMDQKDQAE